MLISKIEYLGLEKFYELLYSKSSDEKLKNDKFLRNYPQLLSHVSVNMIINNVSEYEYIYLKMFASNVVKLSDFYTDPNYVEETYPEIKATATSIGNVFYAIDASSNENKISRMYTPAGLNIANVSVTFTGANLVWLTSLIPETFFIKAGKKNSLEFPMNIPKNELDDYVAQEFIHYFYKFMKDKATYVDLLSDAYNHEHFLNHSQSPVNMLSIRNPYFSHEINDNNYPELVNKFNDYKDRSLSKKFTIENTYMEVALRIPFVCFCEFLDVLPYSKITCMDALTIPASDSMDLKNIPATPEFIKENYNTRFTGRITAIVNSINENYSNNASFIKQLELTENYIPYSFNITISFKDLDRYFLPYIDEIAKSPNRELCCVYTSKIMQKIIDLAVAISKQL